MEGSLDVVDREVWQRVGGRGSRRSGDSVSYFGVVGMDRSIRMLFECSGFDSKCELGSK